ncbi:cation:proton antiporter [soil metagenome]
MIATLLLAAASGTHGDHDIIIFFIQLTLLILTGRLLGEALQRVGQPPVMGQLLAGIVLGPSIFGTIWPDLQQSIFPPHAADRAMLKGFAEFGVLMLLLLTGMETDLALVKRVRRSAAFTSIAGVIVPFAVGYLLGEMLPDNLLPDPNRRIVTSLFLATALSISSVKIVAVVLRETGFFRRDLGLVILASAILDDIIGWIILSLIGGLAAHGAIQTDSLLVSVIGTLLFLTFCFTLGKRIVAWLIRWTNDTLLIEMPVVSLILVLMLVLGLLTNAIGVHTVLGAFMAGIMVGQSPILTKHIDEQLRGIIVTLFMPVFFGVAGLSIDLRVLADPRLLGLTALLIAVASFGKLGGCYFGSRLGGLGHREAFAIGCGMNARGSTEVILASIGLAIGALNQELFTIIVLMAVLTTLAMPPTLRWALGRVPIKGDEKKRLESESAREQEHMSKLERVLVAVDRGPAGLSAAQLAGALVGTRRLSASVIELHAALDTKTTKAKGPTPLDELTRAAQAAADLVKSRASASRPSERNLSPSNAVADAQAAAATELVTFLHPPEPVEGASPDDTAFVMSEAAKGYDLLILGLTPEKKSDNHAHLLKTALHDFPGPVAVLMNVGREPLAPLQQILAPATGADFSRFGVEIAIGLAKGTGASVTALHIATLTPEIEWATSLAPAASDRDILADIEALGKREGVRVQPRLVKSRTKEQAILRESHRGRHQLIVLGIKSRPGEASVFGPGATAILESANSPVLIVKS